MIAASGDENRGVLNMRRNIYVLCKKYKMKMQGKKKEKEKEKGVGAKGD